MGKQAFSPLAFKTENDPAYRSATFKMFCKSFHIFLTTGIPHNPQGQGIDEHAQCMLKIQLYKQKGGILPFKIYTSL